MSDFFGDHLPFVNLDPLYGAKAADIEDAAAIQHFEVPPPTDEDMRKHRELFEHLQGDQPTRRAAISRALGWLTRN